MQDFRQLRVWHLAKDFAVAVARAFPMRVCRQLPGFRSQALRAALSISANIAEGCGKRSRDEFRRYLETGLSSLLEVENYLDVAATAGLGSRKACAQLSASATVLRRMLISLMASVDRDIVEEDPARTVHRAGH